jgi:hypothetical protein
MLELTSSTFANMGFRCCRTKMHKMIPWPRDVGFSYSLELLTFLVELFSSLSEYSRRRLFRRDLYRTKYHCSRIIEAKMHALIVQRSCLISFEELVLGGRDICMGHKFIWSNFKLQHRFAQVFSLPPRFDSWWGFYLSRTSAEFQPRLLGRYEFKSK